MNPEQQMVKWLREFADSLEEPHNAGRYAAVFTVIERYSQPKMFVLGLPLEDVGRLMIELGEKTVAQAEQEKRNRSQN